MNQYFERAPGPNHARRRLQRPARRPRLRFATAVLALIAGAAGIVAVSLGQPGVVQSTSRPISMTAAVTVDTSYYYALMARHSGKVLQVAGDSRTSGAAVQQGAAQDGSTNQQFLFRPAGNGNFRIRARSSGMVVDVSKNSTANGARVIQWADHGGYNQQWSIAGSGNGYVNLVSRNSGKALDVSGASRSDAAPVIQWPRGTQANQQWRLVRLDKAATGGPGTGAGTSPSPSTTAAPTGVPTGTSSAPAVPATSTTAPAVPATSSSGPASEPVNCSVSPVTPDASVQTKHVLCYLYSLYGKHILSGQQESTWVNGPDYEMNYIHDRSGKYPAVRGMDFEQADVSSRAISWWRAGGIPMVSYHMGAPTHPDTYEGSQLAVSIDAVLTPGTAEYTSFTSRLDYMASEIQKMKNANTPVLLRPFHEAGGTWFWWSKEGGAQYQRLWKFTFNYLTRTKGLNNIIWLLPFDGSPSASFYPGKAYIDLGGADTYAGGYAPQTGQFNDTKNILGSTMPLALHENGAMPDPDKLQSTGTRWVLFNTWHTTWLTTNNSDAQIKKTYQSPYVVSRDEVPDLR